MLKDSCCLSLIPHSLCLPQGEVELEMGEDTQENESGLLTMHDVTRAHAGVYQCTANNDIGLPATADVKLVVQCEFDVFVFSVIKDYSIHIHILISDDRSLF